ncbi:ketosteroid isomerase-like protein [Sphingomonas zeicaulis]|uniref:nuclear transport factor 2 family protein n=1 Tax=Sphingomonas zeicaulis TaxID=1632740 RepID=UPI003D1E27BA
MAVTLPGPIAEYFAADAAQDAGAVARCFSDEAIVRDEGHAYSGRTAIRVWKEKTARKYDCTFEPVAVATEGDRTVVTGPVVGNFPGSPIDLRYAFTLDGGTIAGLEVAA